jgi:spermidine/putrescine transport system substrate-binding protein
MTRDTTVPEDRLSALGRRLTRRELLRAAGVTAGAVSLAPILAACASSAAGPFDGKPDGIVNFANWPLYIDKVADDNGVSHIPSLEAFTRDTGIQVNYRQVIEDAETFFRAIEKWLRAGEPTGWDIMVITNGQTLSDLIKLDYLMELPANLHPAFDENADSTVTDPAYDPKNRYTMAWQSGITGIAYNPELTGRPITSLSDLFDPAFKGMVGMFGDTTDLPNLALLAAGAEPETSTEDDWKAAAEMLAHQKAQGLVRDYFTQGYINALRNGEVALTMAWSGDIFQEDLSGSTRLEFVVPDDGAIIWTDCMCIPQAAQHPLDAITLMDYVYRPDVAATIAAGAQYITPVPGSRAILEQRAAEATGDEAQLLQQVATSPLVFPSDEDRARLHTYRVLTEDEAVVWNRIFAPFQA